MSNSRPITAAKHKHAQRFVAEAFDAPSDHVAHTGRKADLVEVVGDGPAAVVAEHDPARLAEMSDHLAGEERVPVGLAPQRVREPDTVVVEVVTGRGAPTTR